MTRLANTEPTAQIAPPAAGADGRLSRLARWLAPLFVASLALHSWPVGGAVGRQVFWPCNLILLAWMLLMAISAARPAGRRRIVQSLPPASVWAYLLVCLLSIAAADHASRALTAAAKIWICCIAVYTLIGIATTSEQKRRVLVMILCGAAFLAVAVALAQRLTGRVACAPFDSPLKLATFLAMTVPVAWVYLVSQRAWPIRVAGAVLACGGLLACTGMWALAGIVVGIIVAGTLWPAGRRWLVLTMMAAAVTFAAAQAAGALTALRQDARLVEADGPDLRQRYLEWQALLNLLAERPILGAGIGCLNDHRGEYYLRLPKRNTIAPFDQNGWLATSGEAGLLGLACLCWLCLGYITVSWKCRHSVVPRAVLASLLATVLANVGCAVQYAGLWPAFILLIALAPHSAAPLSREDA